LHVLMYDGVFSFLFLEICQPLLAQS
jgi:hypothetical protein